MPHNKALKAVAAPLDVSNRRMLRILRAACSRPLALRYAPLRRNLSLRSPKLKEQ